MCNQVLTLGAGGGGADEQRNNLYDQEGTGNACALMMKLNGKLLIRVS